jgi:hypothetical protein
MPAKWGAINSGVLYHVLTVDIDRALAHVGLNRYEAMVMQYVREVSWGVAKYKQRNSVWPDPVPCVLHVRDLAKEWGVPRQRLQEAKASLVDRRILIEENCSVTISKVVEMWVGLSPESMRYADKAAAISGTENRAEPSTEKRASPARKTVPPGTEFRATPERNSVLNGTENRASAPIEERARSDSVFKTGKYQTDAGWRETPSQKIESKPADPALPDIEDADLDRRAAALRQITDAARVAFGWRGEEWATRYGHEYTERVPAVLAAIRDGQVMERSGKPIESVGGFVRMKLRNGPGRGVVASTSPAAPKYTREQIDAMEARRAASIRPAKGYNLTRKVD